MISNFGTGQNFRAGYVAQLDLAKRIEYGIYERNTDMFGFQMPIEDGDSGGPVFLYQAEHLEAIGIVSWTSMGSQGIGYAVRINSAMDEFRAWQNEREW